MFNARQTEWNSDLKLIELENFDLYYPEMVLYQLHLMDVQSVIIEGGRGILDQFIKRNLWDEARILVGGQRWGEGINAQIDGNVGKEMIAPDRQNLSENRARSGDYTFKISAISEKPFSAATSEADCPKSFSMCISAPFSNKMMIISMFPCWAAK